MATRRQGGRQPGAWRAEAARLRKHGGWSSRRIAAHLGVSHTAVDRHLKNPGAEPKLPPSRLRVEEKQFLEPRLQQRIGWREDDDDGPLDEMPEYATTPGCYRTRPAPSSDDA